MDYFINIPKNTMALGLHDYYLRLGFQPDDSKFSSSLIIHHFTSNKTNEAGNSIFGQEIDLTLKYDFIKGTTLTWGGSLFLPGNLMKTIFTTPERPNEDTGFWSYLMLSVKI